MLESEISAWACRRMIVRVVAPVKKQRLSECDRRCSKQKKFMRAERDVAVFRGTLAGVSNMHVARFPRQKRPNAVCSHRLEAVAGGLAHANLWAPPDL
jgi:hypothetical protein